MPENLIVLLLAVWVGAIAVLVYVDRAERFLWILMLLALPGVFSSMLPLAISPNVAVVTNGTILILFIGSLEELTSRDPGLFTIEHQRNIFGMLVVNPGSSEPPLPECQFPHLAHNYNLGTVFNFVRTFSAIERPSEIPEQYYFWSQAIPRANADLSKSPPMPTIAQVG